MQITAPAAAALSPESGPLDHTDQLILELRAALDRKRSDAFGAFCPSEQLRLMLHRSLRAETQSHHLKTLIRQLRSALWDIVLACESDAAEAPPLSTVAWRARRAIVEMDAHDA